MKLKATQVVCFHAHFPQKCRLMCRCIVVTLKYKHCIAYNTATLKV